MTVGSQRISACPTSILKEQDYLISVCMNKKDKNRDSLALVENNAEQIATTSL